MKKFALVIVLIMIAGITGCQNGHKSQSWHTPTPKKQQSKKR